MFEITSKEIKEGFNEVHEELQAAIFSKEENFSEIKKTPVIVVLDNGEKVYLDLSRLLLSVTVMNIIIDFIGSADITAEHFFTDPVCNKKTLFKFIQKMIDFSPVSHDQLCDRIAKTVSTLSDIAIASNESRGNTINIYSLVKLCNVNQEFAELIHFNVPDGLQFVEIESLIKEKLKRFVEILGESDTPYRRLINCGSAINEKQLGQAFMNVGLKPDLHGNVLPEPINTSFLRGMRHMRDFLYNAMGARKALITNFKQVKDSGYLSRKFRILVNSHRLTAEEDCNSRHPLRAVISSKEFLHKVDGRYYYDTEGNEGFIDESMSHLIGKEVFLRSPATCTSVHNHNRVRLTEQKGYSDVTPNNLRALRSVLCNNHVAIKVISGVDEIFPAVSEYQTFDGLEYDAALVMVEQKHNPDTKIVALISNEGYDEETLKKYNWLPGSMFSLADELKGCNITLDVYRRESYAEKGICHKCYGKMHTVNKKFHVGAVGVTLLANILIQLLLSSKHLLQTKSAFIDLGEAFKKWFYVDKSKIKSNNVKSVTIRREDVEEDEEGDLFVKTVFANPNSGDVEEVQTETEVFLGVDLIAMYNDTNDEELVVSINSLSEPFFIKMKNEELSASLMQIIQLIGSNDHCGLDNDIDAIYNTFIELLIKNDIDVQSVHAEIILRALMRANGNVSVFPDFSQEEFPEIEVLSLSNAILHAEFLSESLSFEHIRKQLGSVSTFEKGGTSSFDKLFV